MNSLSFSLSPVSLSLSLSLSVSFSVSLTLSASLPLSVSPTFSPLSLSPSQSWFPVSGWVCTSPIPFAPESHTPEHFPSLGAVPGTGIPQGSDTLFPVRPLKNRGLRSHGILPWKACLHPHPAVPHTTSTPYCWMCCLPAGKSLQSH